MRDETQSSCVRTQQDVHPTQDAGCLWDSESLVVTVRSWGDDEEDDRAIATFCRVHKSLRISPAMAAGVNDTLHDMEWIVRLIDARAPKPKRPATYRKQK